ncbi:hypothetical protein LROSL1_1171 [Furfurilactobacillus rossiae]|uniref:DnaD domain-containing protein n=1 Tax=Furfurilactobacillus rossiae TaxID=231049 RepID=UPI001CDBA384|nr:DnaD domain protein [Furfurilactobacillus rossiae]QLE63988.1 hypothetical protein LROSL1_1171 [Furfurilactobacillus rossiae]
MNYILQLKAFYDRLETNPLNSSEIALWHALMAINNKTAWSDTFAVASSVLCSKAGLKERNFFKARNNLQQSGLVTWTSRKGNQAAIYQINRLYEQLPANNADSSTRSSAGNGADNSAGSSSALTKLNETKPNGLINTTNNSEEEINARKDAFNKIEKEFGRPLSPTELSTIANWFDQDHFEPAIVLIALREAVLNQAYSLRYIDRILIDWQKKNLKSVPAIDDYLQQRRQPSGGKSSSSVVGPTIPLFKVSEPQS